MRIFEVKEEVLVQVLQYLSSRPYSEVADLIAKIQQSKPIEEKDEEE